MAEYKYTYDITALLRYLETYRIDISPASRKEWVKFGLAIKAAGGTAETFAALSWPSAGEECRKQWKRDLRQYLGGDLYHATNGNRESAIGYIVTLCKNARIDLTRFRIENDESKNASHPATKPKQPPRTSSPVPPTPVQPVTANPVEAIAPTYIPLATVGQLAQAVGQTSLAAWLDTLFAPDAVRRVLAMYMVGGSKYGNPQGGRAAVFPYIDRYWRCIDAKIMHYDPKTGSRKTAPPLRSWTDKEGLHNLDVTWIIAELRHQTNSQYYADKRAAQEAGAPEPTLPPDIVRGRWCLFGEHLLASKPAARVNVVESEKSCIILSLAYPDEIWVAVGSKANLTPERLEVLRGRNVVLRPDRDALHPTPAAAAKGIDDSWPKKAEILKAAGIYVGLDGTLESYQGGDKDDLADLVIRARQGTLPPAAVASEEPRPAPALPAAVAKAQERLSAFIEAAPALSTLIQSFNLEPVTSW